MFYKDFYHREMWYLNTRKNTIFLHVKISIISLTSGLSLKLYLNSSVYHWNIFGSSSKVLGNLRTSSEILGKCSGTFVWSSGQFEKSSEIFGRWSREKCPGDEVEKEYYTLARRYEFYVLVLRAISHSFAALTREILFLPLEHKIHIFSPPYNILYQNHLNIALLNVF